MAYAQLAMRGRVALLRFSNPPVNGLSLAIRQGFMSSLDLLVQKQDAKALVIAGEGNMFSGGADIAEFAAGGHHTSPTLNEVIERVSALPIPTVAAVHGTALGGGMELTLACHWRIAAASTKFGLPEVHLGILPGAGGTQRLPRIVGCEAAIQMMTGGAPIDARKALSFGLADEVLPPDSSYDALIERAVTFADALADTPLDSTRVVASRAVEPPGDDPAAFFTAARAAVVKKARGQEAPPVIVDCVQAAFSSADFATGLKREGELFVSLERGSQAKALQHAFFSERVMSKVDGVTARGTPLKTAVVIGAGTMGSGIVACFADAGLPVTLLDLSPAAVDKALAGLRRIYDAAVSKGRLSEAQREKRLSLISTTSSYDDPALASADVVVEAAFESLEVKQKIFRSLDASCKPEAILASNTSTLDIDEIAAATKRPERVIGMHFFSPANVMPLLENVRGTHTSDETIASAMDLGKTLRKKTVLARTCFGFIGNRCLEGYLREACYMLEEGAVPADVDSPMRAFGMAMGPLQMSDLAGNDIGYSVRSELKLAEHPTERYYGKVADKLYGLGRHGQKTKAGWYDYSAGRTPVDDPVVEQLLVEHSAAEGFTRRDVGPSEVVDRLLLPLVNEGFKCLEQGIAQRESDVDMVFLFGYGFPRVRGGPLFWARHGRPGGLAGVVADLEKYGAANPNVSHWKPSALLVSEAGTAAGA